MSQNVFCQAGEVLIQEGADDTRLFVLESGELEIQKGGKVITTIDTPSSIVGEIGVVLEQRRTCSVIAKTDCSLVLVGNSINEIIESSPRLTKLIMQDLAERLVATTASYATVSDQLLRKGTG